MRYDIKVTNKETKTVWTHELLTKEEIEWIKCNPNLIVQIRNEIVETNQQPPSKN